MHDMAFVESAMISHTSAECYKDICHGESTTSTLDQSLVSTKLSITDFTSSPLLSNSKTKLRCPTKWNLISGFAALVGWVSGGYDSGNAQAVVLHKCIFDGGCTVQWIKSQWWHSRWQSGWHSKEEESAEKAGGLQVSDHLRSGSHQREIGLDKVDSIRWPRNQTKNVSLGMWITKRVDGIDV